MTKRQEQSEQSGLLSSVFVLGSIVVNQMEGASCFNVGNNFPTNFQSYKKHNQGFGTVHGSHNSIPNLRSFLNDPDVLDSVSFAPDGQMPEWVRHLIEQSELPPVDEFAQAFLSEQKEENETEVALDERPVEQGVERK